MTVLELNCSVCELERHRRYNLTISNAGSIKSERTLIISKFKPYSTRSVFTRQQFIISFTQLTGTHDAYRVDASIEKDELNITITYLNGSDNLGCLVILQPVNGSQVLYQVVYRDGNESSTTRMVVGAQNALYSLTVYDLMDDQRVEESPAVVTQVDMRQKSYTPVAQKSGNIIVHFAMHTCLYLSCRGK